MCLDDGRVVSNFVAQVIKPIVFKFGNAPFVTEWNAYRGFLSQVSLIGGVNAGTEEGTFDRLWGWEAD